MATTLGSKAVGSIVKIMFDGTLTDFRVVHQGKPSDMYDDSCDGTWLLIENMIEQRRWSNDNSNIYEAGSTINEYMNDNFHNRFDQNIRAHIKQVKLPYRQGGGRNGTDRSGADGLSCSFFLLSAKEVGFCDINIPNDGAKLDYFNSGNAPDIKRVAYRNSDGIAIMWFTRSQSTKNNSEVWMVYATGEPYDHYANNSMGIRFAMILPYDILVYDNDVVGNTAPDMPASVNIPDSIQGGTSIEVSWSAASDVENNLEGYIVERSVDGGGTWTQIYQGSATKTTNTVPAGSATVMYRVKAYDSEGLYSAYRNSAQVSVFNNAAPNAPSSITVPESVLGGADLTVTWSVASDPDNNLAGYELERQVNGGSWAQVYKGADTSYTDEITRGWASVNYRVRAYDAYNAASGYITGTARTVNNNRAPVITCGEASGTDLGIKDEDFSVSYSVGDADDDPVTVTEAIDGVTLRTFSATAGESNTFEVTSDTFFKLLNGAHTLTVEATDGQVTAVHRLTFTKEVTAASVTLIEPFAADDKITVCVLSVEGNIPADADFTVEVTNNAMDDAPVWEDCTVEVKNGGNHIFTNEAAANGFAFNFRVSVERGPSGQGGYINSVKGGFQ